MNDPFTLRGKTIWVTGGAGYFGSSITEALDGRCEKVICVDLGSKAATMVKEKSLSKTIPVSFDIMDVGLLATFITETIEQHGIPNGIVHLAYTSSAGRRLEEMSGEEFQRTFNVTLPSTFLLCREFAERLKDRQQTGSMVLFASMYGVVAPDPRIYGGGLVPNPIDYGASKAAILQMARYFAVHYGPVGVRFNCVTPGPFPNPVVQRDYPKFIQELGRKTALQRIGQNPEIVAPTLFLLGDGASFVTGHSLVVDGGWTSL